MSEMERAMIAERPVLLAYREGIQLYAWCEHERRWHAHGACDYTCHPARRYCREGEICACPLGTGDGSRSPHCSCENSGGNGYVLREVGPFTPAIEKAHRVSRAYGCPTCHPAAGR